MIHYITHPEKSGTVGREAFSSWKATGASGRNSLSDVVGMGAGHLVSPGVILSGPRLSFIDCRPLGGPPEREAQACELERVPKCEHQEPTLCEHQEPTLSGPAGEATKGP